MAKPALTDLYDIMNDGTAGLPTRIRAGVAASRIERLSLPGEEEPPGVTFLRSIVNMEHAGLMLKHDLRREAAAGCAYFEKRAARLALAFEVPDDAERREQWRKLINSALRIYLSKHRCWPAGKHMLLQPGDEFEVPTIDPDIAHSALMYGGNRHQRRGRQKVLDQKVPGKWTGSETERAEILHVIGTAAHQRLMQFDLAAA